MDEDKLRKKDILYIVSIIMCLTCIYLSVDRWYDANILINENNNQINIICNDTIFKEQLEFKEYTIQEYRLIISNMHTNYNNQDERFDKMLNYTLNSKEELHQCYSNLNQLDYILRLKYNWNGEVQ